MLDVKALVERYATIDEPVPLKDGLLIYPILVKDYYTWHHCSDILNIDKNSIPDVQIIQMNYLDFLLQVAIADDTIVDGDITIGMYRTIQLLDILALCFHIEKNEIKVQTKGKHIVLVLKDIEVNHNEFEQFMKIVKFQNIYQYDDTYIDPEVKKTIEEYYSIKNQGISMPELEDKMACLTAMTGILKKDLVQMTYREFEQVFHRATERIDYQVQKTAELSGMVKFDKPVEHWIYQKKKSLYQDAFTSYEGFRNKIESANG